jgi:hypothetical protein
VLDATAEEGNKARQNLLVLKKKLQALQFELRSRPLTQVDVNQPRPKGWLETVRGALPVLNDPRGQLGASLQRFSTTLAKDQLVRQTEPVDPAAPRALRRQPHRPRNS